MFRPSQLDFFSCCCIMSTGKNEGKTSMAGIFSLECSRPDFHKHMCGECGTFWEHSDQCGGDVPAHECPRCGTEEWYKYVGPEGPIVTNGLCKLGGPSQHPSSMGFLSFISDLIRRLNYD